MTIPLPLYAYFEDSTNKDGETGLTVTVDVWRVTKSSSVTSEIVTDGSATELGDGLYFYSVANADPLTYDYLGVFKTASTAVTSKHAPAIRLDYNEGRATEFGYLTSSPLTAAQTAAAVLDAVAASYDDSGSIGEAINNAGGGSVTVNSFVAVSATVAASVSSGRLALQPYATFRQAITSTSTLALDSAAKLWLAVKPKGALDAESIIFIEKTAGLTVLASATYATVAHGSLTVSGSSGAWSVACYVDEIATSLLASYDGQSIPAELKTQSGTDDVILWSGFCDFSNGLIITL